MICETLSFVHICKRCQAEHLKPSLYKRTIASNVLVYSFYRYSDIENILHTKHTPVGFYMYSILATIAFKKFSDNFVFNETVASISIDDHTRSGYSHTAILNRALRSDIITPCYGKMRANNSMTYSGKSYEFRHNNSRDFNFLHVKESDIILVDDIITTGATLTQASNVIQSNNKNLLLCLTLASVE